MAKTPRPSTGFTQLKKIFMVFRAVIIVIIIINTIVTINVYLSRKQPVSPDNPSLFEVSKAYRELDEFEDDSARLAYAANLLNQHMYQSAEKFLSEFLETVDPNSHMAAAICYDLGLAHLYLGEYEKAISDFSTVISQVDYPDAYYNLGIAFVKLQDYENALDAYENAIQLEQKPEYIKGRDTVLALMERTD